MPQKSLEIDNEVLRPDHPILRRLRMARRALEILEEQAAGYTALTIPAHLKIEIEEKRCEVAMLEARISVVNYRIFVVASCDARKEYETACSIVKYTNQHFLGPEIKYQLELSSGKDDFDILIGILWRNISTLFDEDGSQCGKGIDQEIKRAFEFRRERGNGRPAIVLYMKTDPKPTDYAYQDDSQQIREFEENFNVKVVREPSVILAKFKARQTISDVDKRFEFLLLAHLYSVVNSFLREDR